MPKQFTHLLAERLNKISPLHVREAKGGELVSIGKVYVAPGGKHLEVTKKGRVVLTDRPKRHGVKPSCDITLKSFATFGERVLAVILTGMGKDGSDGLCEVKDRNGMVIVEDASTSVIFGMPNAAIKTGYVDKIVPLSKIAKEIVDYGK
jgi:two-component system chemotaxis response regulator CheB